MIRNKRIFLTIVLAVCLTGTSAQTSGQAAKHEHFSARVFTDAAMRGDIKTVIVRALLSDGAKTESVRNLKHKKLFMRTAQRNEDQIIELGRLLGSRP